MECLMVATCRGVRRALGRLWWKLPEVRELCRLVSGDYRSVGALVCRGAGIDIVLYEILANPLVSRVSHWGVVALIALYPDSVHPGFGVLACDENHECVAVSAWRASIPARRRTTHVYDYLEVLDYTLDEVLGW